MSLNVSQGYFSYNENVRGPIHALNGWGKPLCNVNHQHKPTYTTQPIYCRRCAMQDQELWDAYNARIQKRIEEYRLYGFWGARRKAS